MDRIDSSIDDRQRVTLWCPDRQLAAAVRSALAAGNLTVLHARSWREAERKAEHAICTICVVRWLSDHAEIERLHRYKRDFPAHPIVLVTEKDIDNARDLATVLVEALVWRSAVAADLLTAVRHARGTGFLSSLAARLKQAHHLNPKLKAALVHACQAVPPVAKVVALALTRRSFAMRHVLWFVAIWTMGSCSKDPGNVDFWGVVLFGSVTDETGLPVAATGVSITHHPRDCGGTWAERANLSTRGDGTYNVPFAIGTEPSGCIKLQFQPPEQSGLGADSVIQTAPWPLRQSGHTTVLE